MSRYKSYFAVGFFVALLASSVRADPVPPQQLTVDGATAHVYKTVGGNQLRLHVITPANAAPEEPRPAIAFFFSGGWREGSITQFVPQARHFAQRGMVSILVDYRVFGRHGTTPFEAIADAKSALRWVRAHATQLHVDPRRIVASGGSAGGHIALSTAVFNGFDETGEDWRISSKPNALVLFNPPVDTTQAGHGHLQERFGDRALEGSPLHHLGPGLPPTLILHGKADTIAPFADVTRFCAVVRAYGNHCQIVGYEGAKHGFFQPHHADGKWFNQTLRDADKFLIGLGYEHDPVTMQIP
jgi:acetyl esterase/lipase